MNKEADDSDTQSSLGRSIYKGGILLLIGVALFFVPGLLDRLFVQGQPRPGQSAIAGTVIRTLESVSSSSATSSKPDRISYYYAVDGDPYCSAGRVAPVTTENLSEYCFDAWEQVNRATVDAYEAGDSIRLFYDISKPRVSAPAQAPHRRSPWILAGLFSLGIGALVIWTSWRGPLDFTKDKVDD